MDTYRQDAVEGPPKSEYRWGDKIALELEIGMDLAKFTIGTQYESRSRSYNSKDCEYCNPEICFPNSSVVVWRCEYRIFGRVLKTIQKEFFRKGPRSEINK